MHSDTDDERGQDIEYVTKESGHCAMARVRGPMALTADETDVASLGAGGEVYLRERRPEQDREVRITSDGGALRREARVDGQASAYDAATRAWVAAFLPQVMREAGINVGPRVSRLRAQGGVSAVLAEIGRIHSGGVRRAYYEALLAGGPMSDDEYTRVTQQAVRDLTSSGDLSSVLRRVPGGASSPAVRAALAAGLDHIASSGDRRETIMQLLPTANRDLLLTLAHAATGISSSGDRAEFLRAGAAQYLSKRDAALRSAWFDVATTVPSSGDLADVLRTALPYGHGDAEVARLAMVTVDRVPSSGDKAEVLVDAASQRLLTTPAVREAYLAAARNVASSGDRERVLEAAGEK